jgi:hypothetical protein
VLVAAAVVVAGVVSLRRGVDPPELRPPASPPVAQLPRPPGQPLTPLPPTPVLAFGDVCRPIRPAGPSALDVSFSLRNNSDAPVALTEVAPRLPLAGLRERGYTVRSGGCDQRGRPLADNRTAPARPVEVPPTAFVVATLHFALPDECPKPYPVLAVVTERTGRADPISTEYPLLADLGEVSFPNC